MSRSLSMGVVALMAVGCLAAADSMPVVSGNTEFACDLYSKLRTNAGNVFFSPFSVSAALGMTAAGAKGDTLAEMVKTLHLPDGVNAHAGFAELFQQFNAGPKAAYELSVANALWGQKGFPFRPEFKDLVGKYYGGGMRDVDYSKPVDAAATINRWVSDQTKDRIKDIVAPQMLKPITRLVLTNAIYFKGQWQFQFRKDATKEEPFFVADGKSDPVPMMHQSGHFRYAEVDGVQVLELPYKGNRLSMVLMLPKEKNQLERVVEPMLNPVTIAKMLNAAQNKLGDVALPRFEFKTEYRLEATLQELGMKRAFGAGADLSGIISAEALMIDFVVHKAFVKTDEEGSEAAAATAVGVTRAPAPIVERFNFRADHPFVFMIRDMQTGTVLFMGRVANPKG
jgi:serpin B